MFRRIPCDWFLTDGILPAVRLETPETVPSALRHAGLLPRRETIMDGLKDEWVYRRVWRYSARFAAQASARRRFLSVTGLKGNWSVSLNDGAPFTGNASVLEAEVSHLLKEGENLLEIAFAAPDCAVVAPETGFCGAFSLRETGDAVLSALRIDRQNDACSVWRAQVVSRAPGSAVFRAQIRTRETTKAAECAISLQGGEQTVSLTPFAGADEPREDRATMTLQLLLDGEVSDEISLPVYFSAAMDAPRGFVGADEFTVSAAARMGASAVYAGASSAQAAEMRLTALNDAPETQTALTAMPRKETLVPLLDGDLEALNADTVWRLTDSDRAGLELTRRLFGTGTGTDSWEEIGALSRYYQAVDLRVRAEDARMRGEAFLLDRVVDARPVCASRALFDAGCLPRPACFALADAWKRDHAFVRPPERFPEDGIINIPIYYVFDGKPAGVTVTAEALRSDGQELVRATFPVAGRSNALVGRLCTEVPEDGCVFLRAQVMKNGETLSVSDDVICAAPGSLRNLRKTQLIWEGNLLKNVGSTAAVGVSVPGAEFFGNLMPGQALALTDPGQKFAEGINIYF